MHNAEVLVMLVSVFLSVLACLLAIASVVACGFLGYWLAGKVPMPKWIGAVVGVFFHLPGCGILAAIWLVAHLSRDSGADRIGRAAALLESYGYTVTPPPQANP
jgi:hypothetical protein